MKGKKLKLITEILAIVVICLVSFVGIYTKKANKMENQVKDYELSKDISGYRELIFKVSDATEVLDSKGKELYCGCVSKGSFTGSEVPIRKIVELCMRYNAYSAIIAHNHPSGNVMPSKQDYLCTAKLYGLLRAVGSRLVDHIILSNDKYFSFYYTKILPLICEQYEQVLAKTLEHSRHESLSA